MNKKKKILTVIGARPQFIKAAPVSKALTSKSKLKEVVVHTGQHYDKKMSDIFFKELGIRAPDYSLGIGSGSHGEQTGKMLEQIETVLIKEKPEIVLVYGDTNSTMAGALAAVKLKIPVAHVEAGLRSFNREMPEEINRIVTDHVSTLLFCPTETAIVNLKQEGVQKGVTYTGDVMYDATVQFGKMAACKSKVLEKNRLSEKKYALTTIHRAENTDNIDQLKRILEMLDEFAKDMNVIFPVHPRTKKMIHSFALQNYLRNIKAIDPVGYLDMLQLEINAAFIITDSGGIQKEAYFNRTPCITLRKETEWVETVKSGWNVLVEDMEFSRLSRAVLFHKKTKRNEIDEYGDGHAAIKIAELLC